MHFVVAALVAGLLASLACGLGVLPLAIRGLKIEDRMGIGYAIAGGLMFAASIYNLLLPAFTIGPSEATRLMPVLQTLGGMYAGCLFLWLVEGYLTAERMKGSWLGRIGGRVEILVFVAMAFHSIPEGVAVGVGFGSEGHQDSVRVQNLGVYIAIAIAIHNIPEGLAVALPMRAAGASLTRCFCFAVASSLPQPIAAVPASLLVWFFEPLMLPFLGFAAGAMMYLVVVELIPDALETRTPTQIAWWFMAGFGLMTLVQVLL